MELFDQNTLWFESQRIMIVFNIRQRYELIMAHCDHRVDFARRSSALILYSSRKNESLLFPTKDIFFNLPDHTHELNQILDEPKITRTHVILNETDLVQFKLMML